MLEKDSKKYREDLADAFREDVEELEAVNTKSELGGPSNASEPYRRAGRNKAWRLRYGIFHSEPEDSEREQRIDEKSHIQVIPPPRAQFATNFFTR